MSGYGVGIRRDSPLKEEIDEVLLELQYNGDIERLQSFWQSGACHAKKDKRDKSQNKIGILNFISAFILLAVGVLLGLCLLTLEHLYFKSGRKCLKKYDKCGCCALVSLVSIVFKIVLAMLTGLGPRLSFFFHAQLSGEWILKCS